LTEAAMKRPWPCEAHDEAAGVVPSAGVREEQRRFGMANWVLSRQRRPVLEARSKGAGKTA
jgi:hypothetical protein